MSAVVNPSDPHQPLPVAMVARRLGESRQTVHAWVKSGKLQPAGYAPDGRPLVRYIDAAEVEKQMRDDPRSSRRRSPRRSRHVDWTDRGRVPACGEAPP